MEVNDIESLRFEPGVQETQTQTQTLGTNEKSGLGRDAFLRIFLTQLENQDPLDPQDNTDMIVQLAQFTELETSIAMKDELSGINERLDALLEKTGGGSTSALETLSLLGREVDFEGDTVQLAGDGSSQQLLTVLGPNDESQALNFTLLDAAGEVIGGASLVPRDVAETFGTFGRGLYRVGFEDDVPTVTLPDGQQLPLAFQQFANNDAGEAVPVLVDGEPVPFEFHGSQQYRFGGRFVRNDGSLAQPTFFTTGTVTAVRREDGNQVLIVDGTEIDPAKVIQVR